MEKEVVSAEGISAWIGIESNAPRAPVAQHVANEVSRTPLGWIKVVISTRKWAFPRL